MGSAKYANACKKVLFRLLLVLSPSLKEQSIWLRNQRASQTTRQAFNRVRKHFALEDLPKAKVSKAKPKAKAKAVKASVKTKAKATPQAKEKPPVKPKAVVQKKSSLSIESKELLIKMMSKLLED